VIVAAFKCEGLCGFYNLDKTDDLRQRNGDVYAGEGSGHGKQPKPFIDSWRYFADSPLMYYESFLYKFNFWSLKKTERKDCQVDVSSRHKYVRQGC